MEMNKMGLVYCLRQIQLPIILLEKRHVHEAKEYLHCTTPKYYILPVAGGNETDVTTVGSMITQQMDLTRITGERLSGIYHFGLQTH